MTLWLPTPDESWDQFAEDYEESEEFVIEACRHIGDDPDSLSDSLRRAVCDHYRASRAFACRIDDAMEYGIKTW